MKLCCPSALLATMSMALFVVCGRSEPIHDSTASPLPTPTETTSSQPYIRTKPCDVMDFQNHHWQHKHLQVMGFVGGNVFTFVVHSKQGLDMPLDLSKLLSYEKPDENSTVFSTFDADDFEPVVRVHQNRDHKVHVVQIATQRVEAVPNSDNVFKVHGHLKSPFATATIHDTNDTMRVSPVDLQILMVPVGIIPSHSYVFNGTLYYGSGRIVENEEGSNWIESSETTPTVGIKNPVCDIVPRAHVNESCVERFRGDIQVNGIFAGIISTVKECDPRKEGLKPSSYGSIIVPTENGTLTLKFDDWSCFFMSVPSMNKESCLYAFGPSAVFQSVQIGSVNPVTTTTPPPYTLRPSTDPDCQLSDHELFEKFDILEYHGMCLIRHERLPANHNADEAIADTDCIRSVHSDRDTTKLDEAVFTPYDDAFVIMVAAYENEEDGKVLGCAVVRMPDFDEPTFVSGVFDEYEPIKRLSTRDIVHTNGNVFLLLDGKITDLFHTRPYFTKEGFKWFPCVHEPVEEKNELYEDDNLKAQREARKPFAYLQLNSDTAMKDWSIIGGYAVRYENLLPKNDSVFAYRKIDIVKSPYCPPRMINLHNRRIFLAPKMDSRLRREQERIRAEEERQRDIARIRAMMKKQRDKERRAAAAAAEAAARKWSIVKGVGVFVIVTAQFAIVVWLKICLDRDYVNEVNNDRRR